MSKKFWILLSATAAIGAIIAALWLNPSRLTRPSPIPIAISRLKSPHSGLLHIAEAKGFFTEEELAATINTVPTGYVALQEMLNGKADVGAAAETPIAKMLAEGNQLKVVATIFTSVMNVGIVGRKDRGILKPQDLTGKRIGVVFGTATHYMLETFLAFHKIPPDSVTIIPAKPDSIVDALVSGDLDAAASWNPFLARMRQQLGDNAQSFSPGDFYAETYNLVVRPDHLPEHREAVDRLLRALLKAEAFANASPEEANRIIATASDADPSLSDITKEPLTHEVTLKQSLVLATENEVRWHFRRGLVPPGPYPNVLDAFDPTPLRRLKPSGVTVVK